MATAAPTHEMWTVVVEADEEATTRTFRLPSISTVSDVQEQYCREVGAAPSAVGLSSIAGEQLSGAQTLREVGEVSHGLKIVKLIPEPASVLRAELYRCPGPARRLSLSLSARPDQVHAAVRREFDLPTWRLFRLRTPAGPLRYNAPLAAQGVSPGGLLQLELGFEVRLEDAWTGEAAERLLYSGEAGEELLGDAEETEAEVRCGRQRLDTGREVLDALWPLDVALTRHEFRLAVHSPRTVSVLDERGHFASRRLWPDDRLRKLLPGARWTFEFEGELLPADAPLRALDLPEHCLLVARAPGCPGKRPPRPAPVPDLPGAPGGELTARGGRPGDGAAAEDPEDVEVRLREGPVRCSGTAGPLRFSDLMARVAERTELLFQELLGRSLHCAGCGRQLCAEEEPFQAVPADCCRVRSLRLEEPPTPPAVTAAGTQTQSGTGPSPKSCRTVSAMTTSDQKVTADFGTQTAAFSSEFAAQHPPPPLTLLVDDWTGGRRRTVPCDLRPGPLSVGVVREAVATAVERWPRVLKLQRAIGRAGTAFAVSDAAGRWWSGQFGDTAGRLYGSREVDDNRWAVLDDDDEPFLFCPSRRNFILAYEH